METINVFKTRRMFLMVFIGMAVLSISWSCDEDELAGTGTSPEEKLLEVDGYPIVGTNQIIFYNNETMIDEPVAGDPFYGQDPHYTHNSPNYVDNGNGTVTDVVTGLVWSQSPDLDNDGDIDAQDKLTFQEAQTFAASFDLAGHTDWRVPTIKELYSLILFSGIDPSANMNGSDHTPFIHTEYFDFGYGDESAGERIIDAQFVTSTLYVDYTMGGNETMFGVNFADGRIKGYPVITPHGSKEFYVYLVRGNLEYGQNQFVDNGNGTVTDEATGLMWMQGDNGEGLTWQEALSYAVNFSYAGHTDWRLPTIKELQSIVDYTRSPSTTSSPAIDPVFSCTGITNEADESDYAFYWSGTTHSNAMQGHEGRSAAYISFGRAMGNMDVFGGWVDVHGAGAQRSDPKSGSTNDYPYGHGPQGDAIRINNFVRLVRNIN